MLGLKWDAIDFEENTLEIKHIVTQASIDGKKVLVQADRAKTKSSLRTLPLVPPIRDRLLMLKGQQETYRRLCGKSYNRDYLGYLCVDEIGNIIRPNYVSEQFPKLLEKNGLRPIRFHDLRHSCASLLLANGVPMKQIQEWLGHSDFAAPPPPPPIFTPTSITLPSSRLHRRCWRGWAMAMRQHDAIRPQDRVDGRCSGKKEWTDE